MLGTAGLVTGSSAWSDGARAAEVHAWLRSHQQRTPLAAAPKITDISHSKLCYDPAAYCGHPRQAVFKYFGGGEMIVGHNHAPCRYRKKSDVAHGLAGYHGRAVVLLQRSVDFCRTWPEDHNVVIYNETCPAEKKRAFLYPKDARREHYDMFRPESVFFFGRTFLPERGRKVVCFALRSADKGRTWEKVPTIIQHPEGEELVVHKDCHPVIRMPDGTTLLAAMSIGAPGDTPAIYASTDHGLTWKFLDRVVAVPAGTGRFTYAGLLVLPDSRLQCYHLNIADITGTGKGSHVEGIMNAICMSSSTDGGTTWTEPTPIVGTGGECWAFTPKSVGGRTQVYRSPWPMLLNDGRILVVFARRKPPRGIGGTISADGGATWSHEFIIRADDTSNGDLGYPVGCQLEDGRIFIAYYYNEPGKGYYEAVRFIGGTFFRIGPGTRDSIRNRGHG